MLKLIGYGIELIIILGGAGLMLALFREIWRESYL
jgi:hypothetical protein